MFNDASSSSSNSSTSLSSSLDDHMEYSTISNNYSNNNKLSTIRYSKKNPSSSAIIIMIRSKRFMISKIIKFLFLITTLAWIYYVFANLLCSSNNYSTADNVFDEVLPNTVPSSIVEFIQGEKIESYEDDENGRKYGMFQISFKDINMNYTVQMDDEFNCNGKNLLVIILSRPNAFQKRMAIRNTWLKNVSSTVIHRFIIGSTTNKSVKNEAQLESQRFNDLIITNITDSYTNLTLKTYALMNWQQAYCPNVEYLLKADDDTVVNINRLQYWINNDFNNVSRQHHGRVMFGRVWSKTLARRKTDDKWYTPFYAWNKKYFPSYCNGPTYLLTSKAVNLILNQTTNHYFITIEDAFYTGILASAANIKRMDRWKIFGKELKCNKSNCDEKNVPYLTSIYDIGNNANEFRNESQNPFKDANDKLSNLVCSKWYNNKLCGLL